MSDDELEVYIFEGHDRENAPENVEKVIVNYGVEDLPHFFCENCLDLVEAQILSRRTHLLDKAIQFFRMATRSVSQG